MACILDIKGLPIISAPLRLVILFHLHNLIFTKYFVATALLIPLSNNDTEHSDLVDRISYAVTNSPYIPWISAWARPADPRVQLILLGIFHIKIRFDGNGSIYWRMVAERGEGGRGEIIGRLLNPIGVRIRDVVQS